VCSLCLNLTLATVSVFFPFDCYNVLFSLEFDPCYNNHFWIFSQVICNPIWGLRGHFPLELSPCYNNHLWLKLAIVLVYVLFPFKFSPCYNNHFWSFSKAICNPIWGLKGHFPLELGHCYKNHFWSFSQVI
jgi:hypothetical protein